MTIICPKQVNILGKVWNQGKLSPSSHLMSTIAHVSPPVTVKQMRSFTGSVKQIKYNIKDYHLLLHPLEKVDNATGLVKLVGDSQLERYKIKIETGRKNNKDSNPVAEKTVKEFREQQLKLKPQGGVITELEKQ